MNETINTIISRRSVKAYTDELVSDYLLNEITTAATYSAPVCTMKYFIFSVFVIPY